SGVILVTPGGCTVTATDTVSGSVTGTSNTVTVSAAAATHFTVSAPAMSAAGASIGFTVTALDQFGNTAVGYIGTVQFSKSDAAPGLRYTAPTPLSPATTALIPSQAPPRWSRPAIRPSARPMWQRVPS